MHAPESGHTDVGLDRPNTARMVDYYLGGSHNFATDRATARQLHQVAPTATSAVHATRAFLAQAVRHACDDGVDQFLDLGAGIPTIGATHETLIRHRPAARVVYVDTDPVTVEITRHLVVGLPHVGVVHADLRDVGAVLHDPSTRQLINTSQPMGILLGAVLHHVPGDLTSVLARYRQVMTPGSILAITHATTDGVPPEQATAMATTYAAVGIPWCTRSRTEIRHLFDGLDLLHPGLVRPDRWRPDPGEQPAHEDLGTLGGVGLQPWPPPRSRRATNSAAYRRASRATPGSHPGSDARRRRLSTTGQLSTTAGTPGG